MSKISSHSGITFYYCSFITLLHEMMCFFIVWIRVIDENGNDMGDINKVYISSLADISDLRNVVKSAWSPMLDYLAMNQLSVFPISTTDFSASNRILASSLCPTDSSSTKPLLVVVPMKPNREHGKSLLTQFCIYSSETAYFVL